MNLILLMALAAPPPAPPVDQRLTELENRMAAVEAKLGINPAPVAQNATATSEATYPTWHYPPGTTMVRDGNGVLVPSQPATHISYPGQPMKPISEALPEHRTIIAPPPTAPVVQPQPMMFSPPPMAFGGPMRFGRACVGRS